MKAIRKDPDTNYQNDENVGETEEGMDRIVKYETSLHTISDIRKEKYKSPYYMFNANVKRKINRCITLAGGSMPNRPH